MWHRAAVITLVTLALSFPLMGQEAQKSPLELRFGVEFNGGTFHDLLNTIEADSGVTANVIVSKEAAELILPPIKLQNATVREMMRAIEGLRFGDVVLEVVYADNVTSVGTRSISRVGRQPENKESRVYDVTQILEKYSVDDVVTAVQTAWEMNPESRDPKLKYHKETNLLIAVGNSLELRTVENVLQELLNQMKGPGKSVSTEELVKEIEMLKKELERIKAQLKKLSEKI